MGLSFLTNYCSEVYELRDTFFDSYSPSCTHKEFASQSHSGGLDYTV